MAYFYSTELLENEIFEEADPDEPEEAFDLEFQLSLEDGSELNCRALAVFLEHEKEYIALESEDGEIRIMELLQGEDDSITLVPVLDEAELEAASQAFWNLYETEKMEEVEEYDRDQDREEN